MKKRLDVLLCERDEELSREKAKALIMSGVVYVDGQKEDKAGTMVKEEAQIEVRSESLRYVSRGGLKLEKAIEVFPVELSDKVCMDVGASTGGFTDCMLQQGARKVYSIDVGHGQLHWKLRNDERVVCLERTNFRYVTRQEVPEEIGFASCDVSFISLELMLPAAYPLLAPGGQMVCLIKPQFEAGRELVGKKGVVRDPAVHSMVIEQVKGYALKAGFSIYGLDFSPVKGPEGNIEYLIFLIKDEKGAVSDDLPDTDSVVERAHSMLEKPGASH